MSIPSVLSTQWTGYSLVHANRANFVVHLVTVPIFMAGTVAFFWGLFAWSALVSLAGIFAMMAALAAQGWGHRQEANPPAPFTSRANAFARIMLEQWVTFPRYVLHRWYSGRS